MGTTSREEAVAAPEALEGVRTARGTTARRTSASRRTGATGTTGTMSARLRPTKAAVRRADDPASTRRGSAKGRPGASDAADGARTREAVTEEVVATAGTITGWGDMLPRSF